MSTCGKRCPTGHICDATKRQCVPKTVIYHHPTLGQLAVQRLPASSDRDRHVLRHAASELDGLMSDDPRRRAQSRSYFRKSTSALVEAAYTSFYVLLGFLVLEPALKNVPGFRQAYPIVWKYLKTAKRFAVHRHDNVIDWLAPKLGIYDLYNKLDELQIFAREWKSYIVDWKFWWQAPEDLQELKASILQRTFWDDATVQERMLRAAGKYRCDAKKRALVIAIWNEWIMAVQSFVALYQSHNNPSPRMKPLYPLAIAYLTKLTEWLQLYETDPEFQC